MRPSKKALNNLSRKEMRTPRLPGSVNSLPSGPHPVHLSSSQEPDFQSEVTRALKPPNIHMTDSFSHVALESPEGSRHCFRRGFPSSVARGNGF